MLTSSRLRLLFVLAVALGSLLFSGCFGGRLVIRPFPKRPVVVRTTAPSSNHMWVDGHWQHDDASGRYVWVKGRWVVRVTGKRWVPGHYKKVRRGRAHIKVWVPGHWKGGAKKKVVVVKKHKAPAVVVKAAPVTVVLRELPTAPVVVQPRRPAGHVVWVKGHFRWDASRSNYVWVKGRWVAQQANKTWIPGHYKVERRGALKVRVWVPGHWKAGAGGGGAAVKVKVNPPSAARVVVMNTPALPRIVKPRRPGRTHVWVQGHHVWNPRSRSYKWKKGHWVKPRPGKRWIPGHYNQKVLGDHRVKVWIPGHWK